MSGTPPRSQEQDATDERGATQRRSHPTGRRRRVGRLYPSRSHLHEEVRASSVAALNRGLADATVVRSQLKFAHWNVEGPDLYQLHGLFDDLAATLEAHIDAMAERAVALGGQALGTVRLAAHPSEVAAISERDVDAPAMVERVVDNLATLFEERRAAEGRDDHRDGRPSRRGLTRRHGGARLPGGAPPGPRDGGRRRRRSAGPRPDDPVDDRPTRNRNT